ncbi:hypothetical protein DFQ01_103427 [Paenibacillus cellulosilyticus]|uniref:Uncharacterized protein n=1 Tax=Paenibacillus cellulosilyticus TaxID=375489 RepID=A0A2V2YY06_9BACL|nr:hypothetical protein [Paenibacillus cellulosilyticus]PWW06523.1 hypothetical protein DFQ01_103427 [Paenibacillus cellulosilyticus]QKS46139.1 hypothetical protein HUB94_18125 [Paenibacillus cellulosilyticus]
MKKEHIVHFKIIHGKEVKELRGLLYLEGDEEPNAEDYARLLKDYGHDITRLIDPYHFIYEAQKDGEIYKIDVLENYEKSSRDPEAEHLAKNFMKHDY